MTKLIIYVIIKHRAFKKVLNRREKFKIILKMQFKKITFFSTKMIKTKELHLL